MKKQAYYVAGVLCLSLMNSTQANTFAVLDTSVLPSEIQSCFASGSCTTIYSSAAQTYFVDSFESTNLSAFQYKENNVDKWLVRYNTFSPSHSSGDSYDSWTDTYSSYNTALSGSLWLSANQSYDLAATNHQFNLYFDKISPTQSFMNMYGLSTAHFNLTSGDLLAGGGYSKITYNIDNVDVQGNLISGPGPDAFSGENYWSCIECDVSVQFNLAMLKYSSAGGSAQISFNTADSRAMIFSVSDYHPDFGYGSSSSQVAMYVQPVPLPASFWLFASGLMGLRVLTKRKRK